jgi:glycosyl-4,4'-diaponeurosporenoate acyltransferase
MVVRPPWPVVVALDAVAWAIWSAAAGWWTGHWTVARGPAADVDGPLLRLRPFEAGRSCYQRRLRVKTWKDRLPEAGRAFGGRSKRHLPPGGEAGLPCFLAECRRAERSHWLIVAATPVFALWNPPGLFVAMVAFALAANVPCLVVLRYNRARLLRRAGQARSA